MGGGASTEVQTKVAGASEEDIRKVLAELPEDSKAKLLQALKRNVLIVSTSASKMGDNATGLWSEECCGPYYVFKDAGCDVTVCSIAGGDIPIDANSVSGDFKTENDKRMESEGSGPLKGTPKLADQNIDSFDIIFFSGGHGTCVDFPTDEVGAVVAKAFAAGKVVAAVCHGPMALVKGDVVKGKKVAVFSDKEEEMVGLTGAARINQNAAARSLISP